MNDKAKVTMPLEDFDEMRLESKLFREIREQISECFYDYRIIECAPPFEETIKLDVEQLIETCKRYALYGKDIESDIDDIEIIRETKKNKSKKSKPAKTSTVAALSLGSKPK